MQSILHDVMSRRGVQLAHMLGPYLPAAGRMIDIGAGTGHNAIAIQQHHALQIINLDVVDMHVVGGRPALFDGNLLPFADDSCDGALLLFVLQYHPNPLQLLREVRRVCTSRVLVLQSTYTGRLAETMLRLHDLAWGPLAFTVARAAGMIQTQRCSLYARVLAQRPALMQTFAQAGLRAELVYSQSWPLIQIRRDLFVLERQQ